MSQIAPGSGSRHEFTTKDTKIEPRHLRVPSCSSWLTFFNQITRGSGSKPIFTTKDTKIEPLLVRLCAPSVLSAFCAIPPENHRGTEGTEDAQRRQRKEGLVEHTRRRRVDLTWVGTSHRSQRLRSSGPSGTGTSASTRTHLSPFLPSLCCVCARPFRFGPLWFSG